MPARVIEVIGRSTSGHAKPKWIRVKTYEGGWDVHIGIGDESSKDDKAKAALRLHPSEARIIAEALENGADEADEAKRNSK